MSSHGLSCTSTNEFGGSCGETKLSPPSPLAWITLQTVGSFSFSGLIGTCHLFFEAFLDHMASSRASPPSNLVSAFFALTAAGMFCLFSCLLSAFPDSLTVEALSVLQLDPPCLSECLAHGGYPKFVEREMVY